MIALDTKGISKAYRLNVAINHKLRHVIPAAIGSLLRGSWRRNTEASEFLALNDISFQQEEGEVLGLIGRNGAGKSTLLKIISRVTEPTSGRILVRGRVGSLLELGVGFHPELSGRDNIYLSGTILGMKHHEIKKQFDEIVSFAEIERYVDVPVKRYSSGMKVRLGFSVAAHLKQEILLVDEVLAVGDLEFQRRCKDRLRSFAKSGRTVLFVGHDVLSMRELCDKALYLNKGHLKAYGQAQDICDQYLSDLAILSAEDIDRMRSRARHIATLSDNTKVRFEQITLDSPLGLAITFGAALNYDLAISSTEDLEKAAISFSIFDQLDRCVGTSYYNQLISLPSGQLQNLRLSINNVRLAPGSYSVRFVIGGGKSHDSELDVVLLKPAFEVIVSSEGNPLRWNMDNGPWVFEDVTISKSDS